MFGHKVIIAFVFVGLYLTPRPCLPQKLDKGTDAVTLRTRFITAFGKDFELVNDRLKERSVEHGGGTYWLAFVKPNGTGYFHLQYRYREKESPEILEHEFRFSVGPQGCRRGTPDSRTYTHFCLGDTIIVPVLVNNYSGHEFKLAKTEPEVEPSSDSGVDPPTLDKSAIPNPAVPMLWYVGRSQHRLLHRIPGYTLTLSAEFQAQEPGRMNLLVIAEGAASPQPAFNGVPIIVLPRDAPATLIAGREEVRGYRKGKEGAEQLTWGSSNIFMTDVLILQPGDRIQLPYFSIVRNSDYVGNRFDKAESDPAEKFAPAVSVRPFAPNSRYEFTEWIIDYLPES